MNRFSTTPQVRPDGAGKARRAGGQAAAIMAVLLLLIGLVNWALVGLFGLNPVATIFGAMSTAGQIVCAVLGSAAIVALALLSRLSRPE